MYDATVSLLEGAALSWLATGSDPEPIGNAHFAIAPFDTFACADRDITICAPTTTCSRASRGARAPGLLTDPRFATNAARHAARAALKTELEAVLRTRTADHWLGELDLAGVPCGPISTVAEAVGSEQAAVRRMVVDAGGLPGPGQPLKLSSYDDPAVRVPAPALDEHGASVRAEFG
jgi:CoA:oxalate CoA-transferase